MNDSYIGSLPGMIKGADGVPRDLLGLLNLKDYCSPVDDALTRGYASPPLAVLRIGDRNYDLVSMLEGIGEKLNRTDFECPLTGPVCQTTDACKASARECVSTIVPVQAGSGDPSPENVRPISGWDTVSVKRVGKNLVDIPDFVDTSSKDIYTATVDRFAAVKYKESTQYTLSMKVSSEDTTTQFGARVAYTDGSSMYYWCKNGSTYVPSVTTAAGKTIEAIVLTYNSNHALSISEVQLEEGAVATAYEPYQAESLTADLPETVYGGSLDWMTGVLTVTHVCKAVRAADISYKAGSASVNTSCFVTNPDLSLAAGRLASLCSHFKNTMDTAYTAASARHGIFSDHPTMTTKYFDWGDPDTTITEFKNWLEEQYAAGTPVTLCTLLKEPYTIQLTPQQLDLLKGYNSVWSDCGDTALTYVASPKQYIDNAVARLESAILAMGANI